ncbi:uncharacterized protein KY384_001168 [Bacidia gigantensis]|uniref:uncharacterized protein n=1 Tax=Bacidia gigantensis TaxID=2732470 RepID=UPI001D040FD8|nr:uncharacterized protein KY384_001168 [Bacidia gigantensis]KAG8534324.1 hypothetical protein KY384_001168 [Bacidia gigantensis]
MPNSDDSQSPTASNIRIEKAESEDENVSNEGATSLHSASINEDVEENGNLPNYTRVHVESASEDEGEVGEVEEPSASSQNSQTSGNSWEILSDGEIPPTTVHPDDSASRAPSHRGEPGNESIDSFEDLRPYGGYGSPPQAGYSPHYAPYYPPLPPPNQYYPNNLMHDPYYAPPIYPPQHQFVYSLPNSNIPFPNHYPDTYSLIHPPGQRRNTLATNPSPHFSGHSQPHRLRSNSTAIDSRSGRNVLDDQFDDEELPEQLDGDQVHPHNKILPRQGTGELGRSYGSGKRVRFKVLLRLQSLPLIDEEKGIGDLGYSPSRSTNYNSRVHLHQDLFEIVQTRWTPNDDGQEDVTLTLKDDAPREEEANDQVIKIPGLKSTEIALASRLLNRVRRYEQRYIHGRFLEPMTLIYDGEDPSHAVEPLIGTVTFICFPFFDSDDLLKPDDGFHDHHAHRVRSLLQTQSRLESTSQRDEDQVLKKLKSKSSLNGIHLPQIWALIINQKPCGTSYWTTIRSSPWSAILIKEQLLNNGALYKLVDRSDGEIAYEESWPDMLRSKKSQSLCLALQEKPRMSAPFAPSIRSTGSMSEDEDLTEDSESLMTISVVPSAMKSPHTNYPPVVFRAHEPSPFRPASLHPYSVGPLLQHQPFENRLQEVPQQLPPNGIVGQEPQISTPSLYGRPSVSALKKNAENEEIQAQQPVAPLQSSSSKGKQKLQREPKSVSFALAGQGESENARPNTQRQLSDHSSDPAQRMPPILRSPNKNPDVRTQEMPPIRRPPDAYSHVQTQQTQQLAMRMYQPSAQYQMPQYSPPPLYPWQYEAQAFAPGSAYLSPGFGQSLSPPYSSIVPASGHYPFRRYQLPTPKMTDLAYIPSRKSVSASLPNRNESHRESDAKANNRSQISSTFLDHRNSQSKHTSSESNKARCQKWKRICDQVLASRREMVEFPEPPDWPCRLHDKYKKGRALKACVCNLREVYEILGYQPNTLRHERIRWHPDRFPIEFQRKAEELYKELEIIIPNIQEPQAITTPDRVKTIALPETSNTISKDTNDAVMNRPVKVDSPMSSVSGTILSEQPTGALVHQPSLSVDLIKEDQSALRSTSESLLTVKDNQNTGTDEQSFDVFQYLDDSWKTDSEPDTWDINSHLDTWEVNSEESDFRKWNVLRYLDDSWKTETDPSIKDTEIVGNGGLPTSEREVQNESDDRLLSGDPSLEILTNKVGAAGQPRQLSMNESDRIIESVNTLPDDVQRSSATSSFQESVLNIKSDLQATVEDASDDEELGPRHKKSKEAQPTHLSKKSPKYKRRHNFDTIGPGESRAKDSVHSETPSQEGNLESHERRSEYSPTGSPFTRIGSVLSDFAETSNAQKDPGNAIFLWPTGQSSLDAVSQDDADLSDENEFDPYSLIYRDSQDRPSTGRRSGQWSKNEKTLRIVLDECHERLQNSKLGEESSVYKAVAEKDEGNVTELAGLVKETADESEGKEQPKSFDDAAEFKLLRQKEGIFVLATRLLRAFVPQGYEVEILKKYWGAVWKVLIIAEAANDLNDLEARLWSFLKLIQSMLLGVRTVDRQHKVHYQMPRALPTAFRHLVMVFVTAQARLKSRGRPENIMHCQMFEKSLAECGQCLLEGRNQLILMVHTDDYRERAGYEAIDSTALLSTMMRNLMERSLTKDKLHITELYSEYTTKIQSLVRHSASVSVYTDIELLTEELDAIKSILSQQTATLSDFKYALQSYEGTSELVDVVLDRMLTQLRMQGEDFKELSRQAELARHRAAQSISLKAESNNKAILVFTTVTIIFLPLSFVTSFFGMNTVDMRNINSSQGLFWATGLPLTLFVLGAAWVVAYHGELASLGLTFKSKP